MNEQRNEPLLPPTDPDSEPTDSNPVPLSPTDPKRRTSAGDTPPTGDTTQAAKVPVVPVPATGQTGGPGGALPAAVPIGRPEKKPADADPRPDSEGAV